MGSYMSGKLIALEEILENSLVTVPYSLKVRILLRVSLTYLQMANLILDPLEIPSILI